MAKPRQPRLKFYTSVCTYIHAYTHMCAFTEYITRVKSNSTVVPVRKSAVNSQTVTDCTNYARCRA